RHAVPAEGLERAARDRRRRHHHLFRARQEDRQGERCPRRRSGQWAEPDQPRRAVPSRHRQQRLAHRLWRRAAAQALAARARGAPRRLRTFSTAEGGIMNPFKQLHQGPDVLVLPNAWDAGSARVIEVAGAKAIATSSTAVAWANGYPDGEAL